MKKIFLCVFILLGILTACSKEDPLSGVNLPSDTAINDANRFALVIETYISLRDKPGDDGINIAHARKLDIFPVKGLEITQKDGQQILWVNIDAGWVPRSAVELYSSKEKAVTASKKLK